MFITGVSSISGQQIIAIAASSASKAMLSTYAVSDANGNVITGTYQTTAGMTAYQPTGNYLTEVPATYLQNTDLSTEDGKVTAISGIPLSAGGAGVSGDYELSAGEGISITDYPDDQKTVISVTGGQLPPEADEAISAVTANSGAWGGNAIPVSAGPGVSIMYDNGVLVFQTDETVLWKGTAFTPNGSNNPVNTSVSLAEPITNFEKVRLDFSGGTYFNDSIIISDYRLANNCFLNIKKEQNNNDVYIGCKYQFPNSTAISGYISYGTTQNISNMTGGYWGYGGVCQVVGVNRK